jgi:hypothetical protein
MNGYYLEIVRGIDLGKKYPLSEGAITIGRSDNNMIIFNQNELLVSNHHAVLYIYPGNFFIQDINSKNGTYLNDRRISINEVTLNDVIGFGEKGPRLKLLYTNEDIDRKDSFQQTSGIYIDEISSPKNNPSIESLSAYTKELEYKILNKSINTDELTKLVQQTTIPQKGNRSLSQSIPLISIYGAHLKNRYLMIILTCLIFFLLLSTVVYLKIRIFQIKTRPDKCIITEVPGKKNIIDSQLIGFGQTNQLDLFRSLFNAFTFHSICKDTIEFFLYEILSGFGNTDYQIPPQMTSSVKRYLEMYSQSNKKMISRLFKKKEIYFPMIQNIFEEKNIPSQLAYISMLESGFNPKALSHAGARGLWQFMPHTARKYGLKVDSIYDERIEPQKATYAAAEYLKDLIGIFGAKNSIMLVMAAYNAGEKRIMDALRKIDDPIRDRDFWYIYRMGFLAEETNEYIPQILALMIIDNNREYFGISNHDIATANILETEANQ